MLSELTFDRGDDCAGRAEDVHGVEALVFADDDLQHSQQLPEAFVDGVMQAVVVALYRENVGLIATGDQLCAELKLEEQQSQVDAQPGAARWFADCMCTPPFPVITRISSLCS